MSTRLEMLENTLFPDFTIFHDTSMIQYECFLASCETLKPNKEGLQLHHLPSAQVVLDADYNVVTLKGRDAVTADPTGAELPWHPKPVIWTACCRF